MPTSVQNVPFHNTTDADFRVWGKAISDGIAAVGLTKVADTGTVNWATVTKPAAIMTSTAREVWRLNDALQATAPLFILIEYGADRVLGCPAIWITLGRGSNGAGSITGELAPRRATHSLGTTYTGTPPTSVEPIYISSDGSSLCLSARIGEVANAFCHAPAFVIDRSRDSSGNATATGGVIIVEGSGPPSAVASNLASGPSFPAQMHAWTYSGASAMGDVPAVVPKVVNAVELNGLTTIANGDRGLVFPYVVVVPGHDPWQVLAACAVVAADAANGPFTANVLGRVRNYRSIPIGPSHNRWMSGLTLGFTGLCILWEE